MRKIKMTGFTLIELLVVISIIGLLASIVLVALNNARTASRGAKRAGDLKNMATALELYYNDNGTYPTQASWASDCTSWQGLADANVIPGLMPTYIKTLPSDPLTDGAGKNCLLYRSATGKDYKLMWYPITDYTAAQIVSSFPAFVDPSRDNAGLDGCTVNSSISMAVYTSGAACY